MPARDKPGNDKRDPRRQKSREEARRSFRITAIRRARTALLDRLFRGQPRERTIPVPDEELIEALWTRRDDFERRVEASLQREAAARHVTVTLEELRPDRSILALVKFTADAGEALEEALGGVAAAVTVAAASVLQAHLGDVSVAAIPVAAEADPSDAEAPTKTSSWERLAPVLGAIATGIGVVGFVTFVGGVILSARLDAAGFPTEAALGVVPPSDMLVIGAETLVPPVIWGFLLVAALFVLRVLFLGWKGRLSSEEARVVEEQGPRLMAFAIFIYTAAALVGATAYSLATDLPSDHGWVVAIAVALAFIPSAVGRITSHLTYVVVALFLTMGVFLTYLAFERASSNPQYRGAAVIRANKKATIGFFVAEGSSRIYLARVNLREGTTDIFDPASRLVGIDKSQVSDWGVGGPKSAAAAVKQAKALARELCQVQPRAAPAAAAPAGGAQADAAAKPEKCWTAQPGVRQP